MTFSENCPQGALGQEDNRESNTGRKGNREVYQAVWFTTGIGTVLGIWPYSWKCGNKIEFKWRSGPVAWLFGLVVASGILSVFTWYQREAIGEVQNAFQKHAGTASESFGIFVSLSLTTVSVTHYVILNVSRRAKICGSWNRFCGIWAEISRKLATMEVDDGQMNLCCYATPKLHGRVILQTLGNIIPSVLSSFIFYSFLNPEVDLIGAGIVVLITSILNLLPYASALFICTVTCVYEFMALSFKKLERQLVLLESVLPNSAVINPWLDGNVLVVEEDVKEKSGKVKSGVKNLFIEADMNFILKAIHDVDECAMEFTAAIKYHLLYAVVARGFLLLFGIFFLMNWKGGGPDAVTEYRVMLFGRLGNGIHSVSDAAILFQLCRACERISTQQRKLANRLAKMSCWSHFSEQTKFQVQNTLQKMYGSPTVISPGGFLELNNNLVTSLLTGAVTYIVILMQFNN